MAFCGECGKQVEDGKKFCTSCGAKVGDADKGNTAQTSVASSLEENVAAKFNQFNNTADNTSEFSSSDIEQNKVMAVLAYIGILVLIPIFAAPNSKFARYHSNQGLILAICELVYFVAFNIISVIIYSISWRLGFLVSLIGLVGIVFLILAIIGIVNAANGKAKELPVIGSIKILK